MKPFANEFWTLRVKNRRMIELIQEVLASEDGNDIDWDSWDARAKEALRANNVTIAKEHKKLEMEKREQKKERKEKKKHSREEREKIEMENAIAAIAKGGETSRYARSLLRSAELRKQKSLEVANLLWKSPRAQA